MPQGQFGRVCLTAAAAVSLFACVTPPPRRPPSRDASPTVPDAGSAVAVDSATKMDPPPLVSPDAAVSAADGGSPDTGVAPDAVAAAPSTYAAILKQVLAPGCTAPNGACHSVLRHQYFLFAETEQMRSYMLLVPTAAKVGTVPARVMQLITHVIPSDPKNPTSVSMPPQSGDRLGNPPVRKPPLTPEQVKLLQTWAQAGCKYE
jgi:hypothetical protein